MFNSFRNSPYFQDEEGEFNLYLQVYFDDFNTSKGFSKSTHTKLSVVYITISNLPYSRQSKREQILLSSICKRSDIKDESNFRQFFKPLIDEIIAINRDPIKLNNNVSIKLVLSAIVADNLASNELQCICRCFTQDACKYCTIFQREIRANFVNDLRPIMRELNQSQIFANVEFRGLLFAPDIFHDLNEGVIPLITNWLLKKKCSPDERKRIAADCKTIFKYHFQNGCVYNIEKYKIKGTGAQKLEFFYMLPILMHSISKNSNEWKLYLLLRKIVNFLLSPSFLREDIEVLEQDIKKFCLNYSFFFSSGTFKVHHLTHYVMAIYAFGPLFFYSTLRYERVHQFIKRLVKNSQNFGTLPHQIAHSWATQFSISLLNVKKPEYENVDREYEPSQFDSKIPPYILQLIDRSINLIILKSALINDIDIEQNKIFLYKYKTSNENYYPLFIKIEFIIKQNNVIKLVARPLHTNRFLKTLNCFEIKEIENNSHCFIASADQFKYHKSLNFVNTEIGLLVPITFYIPYTLYNLYSDDIVFNFPTNRPPDMQLEQPDNYLSEESDEEDINSREQVLVRE